jgi:hypothetical protein
MNRATVTVSNRPVWVRNVLLIGGLLLAVAIVVAGSVLGSAAGAAFARDSAVSSAGVLGGSQVASDRLPADFPADLHGTGGIDPASARFLGASGGSDYWIALDRSANVCLLAQSQKLAAYSSASCVAPSELEATGAALRVEGAQWRLEAVLVPDSTDTSALPKSWNRVSDNLAVYTGVGPAAVLTLPRDANSPGAPITLAPLSIDAKG